MAFLPALRAGVSSFTSSYCTSANNGKTVHMNARAQELRGIAEGYKNIRLSGYVLGKAFKYATLPIAIPAFILTNTFFESRHEKNMERVHRFTKEADTAQREELNRVDDRSHHDLRFVTTALARATGFNYIVPTMSFLMTMASPANDAKEPEIKEKKQIVAPKVQSDTMNLFEEQFDDPSEPEDTTFYNTPPAPGG